MTHSRKNNEDQKRVSSISLNKDQKIDYLLHAIDETDNWVVITDEEANIIYANKTVEEVTFYDREEIIGENPSIFKSEKHNKKFYKRLWEIIKNGKVFNDIIVNKKKNDELFYSEQTITPIKDENGKIINYISVGKDITKNKELKNRLEYISNYNIEYDIPNKKALINKINNLIGIDKIKRISLLVININHLKSLNNIYYKDNPKNNLINTILTILNNFLKKQKNILKVDKENYISYLDSNNFAFIIDSSKEIDETYKVAKGILDIFSESINLKEHAFILDPSIGISIYPDDSFAPAKLLSKAEIALIHSQKNDFSFFDSDINKKIKRITKTEAELNDAIKNDEFILYYQPYYDSRHQKVAGLEALLRWNSPKRGLVSPGEFISILEGSKLMKKVGLIVIEKVVKQILDWQQKNLEVVPVSINLSAKQLADKNHLDNIFEIIDSYNVDSSLLKFEITESNAMKDVNYSLGIIEEMKKRGFQVSLDDFGTGYSSFSYLQKFPIDYLKIDISFIRNMLKNKESKKIVEVIINIAHILDLKTIAEGVEEKSQLAELNELSNDYVQGYYYNPPLAAEKIDKLLV